MRSRPSPSRSSVAGGDSVGLRTAGAGSWRSSREAASQIRSFRSSRAGTGSSSTLSPPWTPRLVGSTSSSRRRSRSEEHTSELQSHVNLVCRLLLEKKKQNRNTQFQVRKKKKTK